MLICKPVDSHSFFKTDFLKAMRGITSTVTIISAKKDSNIQAMTASSVVSLSLEPPSMLICINHEASIYKVLEKRGSFCINVLTKEQLDLADICSKKEFENERFSIGKWILEEEVPYNKEAQSNIFCKCTDLFKHKTHTIYLGEVIKVLNKETNNTLLYRDGNYLV